MRTTIVPVARLSLATDRSASCQNKTSRVQGIVMVGCLGIQPGDPLKAFLVQFREVPCRALGMDVALPENLHNEA